MIFFNILKTNRPKNQKRVHIIIHVSSFRLKKQQVNTIL